MLIRASQIKGFFIRATDGETGRVAQLYFDDQTWAVRYFVVKTNLSPLAERVLLSPARIVGIDPELGEVTTNLTADQIRNGRKLGSRPPVSAQKEIERLSGGSAFWSEASLYAGGLDANPVTVAGLMPNVAMKRRLSGVKASRPDPHLRSSNEVTGYSIDYFTGHRGRVHDFLIDTDEWTIKYLEVTTGQWRAKNRLLIASDEISGIDWSHARVQMNPAARLPATAAVH